VGGRPVLIMHRLTAIEPNELFRSFVM